MAAGTMSWIDEPPATGAALHVIVNGAVDLAAQYAVADVQKRLQKPFPTASFHPAGAIPAAADPNADLVSECAACDRELYQRSYLHGQPFSRAPLPPFAVDVLGMQRRVDVMMTVHRQGFAIFGFRFGVGRLEVRDICAVASPRRLDVGRVILPEVLVSNATRASVEDVMDRDATDVVRAVGEPIDVGDVRYIEYVCDPDAGTLYSIMCIYAAGVERLVQRGRADNPLEPKRDRWFAGVPIYPVFFLVPGGPSVQAGPVAPWAEFAAALADHEPGDPYPAMPSAAAHLSAVDQPKAKTLKPCTLFNGSWLLRLHPGRAIAVDVSGRGSDPAERIAVASLVNSMLMQEYLIRICDVQLEARPSCAGRQNRIRRTVIDALRDQTSEDLARRPEANRRAIVAAAQKERAMERRIETVRANLRLVSDLVDAREGDTRYRIGFYLGVVGSAAGILGFFNLALGKWVGGIALLLLVMTVLFLTGRCFTEDVGKPPPAQWDLGTGAN